MSEYTKETRDNEDKKISKKEKCLVFQNDTLENERRTGKKHRKKRLSLTTANERTLEKNGGAPSVSFTLTLSSKNHPRRALRSAKKKRLALSEAQPTDARVE